jgi:aryl-alcohol dehydrogenase-like predicted oxidoreductase
VYGWSVEHGHTERILGNWFALGDGRRDAVVLATKVYNPVTRRSNRPEVNTDGRSLSAYKIRKHCEGSLKRLQTDWIDLYQMHHIDRACPWSEIWTAFDALNKQGKIVYVGSSNFAAWGLATGCQEAYRRGLTGLVSEQSIYHLNNRMLELEVIPACRHYGMGLLPWSPLDGGFLAGALEQHTSGRRRGGEFEKRVEKHRHTLEQYEGLCRDLGHPPSEVALAWLLHNPAVTAPIIGPRTLDQLESAVRATGIVLDAATLARLDEIFPGPGGEAPEAYSW